MQSAFQFLQKFPQISLCNYTLAVFIAVTRSIDNQFIVITSNGYIQNYKTKPQL